MAIRDKCIVWGMGNDYESILNQIQFEIYKGNIEVIAIVCREEDIYCECRDGFPVFQKENVKNLDFDYVIISSSSYLKQIQAEIINLGIARNRIINGQIFKKPLFDFKMYSQLIKNPVTIITDDCWGGMVYHYLDLPFTSPLVNTHWDKDEYARFIEEPSFYLQSELTMVRDGNLREGIYPIGRLGEPGKYVQIEFVHNIDFSEAKQQWDRRKKRINWNNLFVKMGFKISDQNVKTYLNVFENCKYRKILFYNGDEDIEGKYCTNRFIWHEQKAGRVDHFTYWDYMRGNYLFSIDILKLLTGERDYSREL